VSCASSAPKSLTVFAMVGETLEHWRLFAARVALPSVMPLSDNPVAQIRSENVSRRLSNEDSRRPSRDDSPRT
jgi:hypothetical protein